MPSIISISYHRVMPGMSSIISSVCRWVTSLYRDVRRVFGASFQVFVVPSFSLRANQGRQTMEEKNTKDSTLSWSASTMEEMGPSFFSSVFFLFFIFSSRAPTILLLSNRLLLLLLPSLFWLLLLLLLFDLFLLACEPERPLSLFFVGGGEEEEEEVRWNHWNDQMMQEGKMLIDSNHRCEHFTPSCRDFGNEAAGRTDGSGRLSRTRALDTALNYHWNKRKKDNKVL